MSKASARPFTCEAMFSAGADISEFATVRADAAMGEAYEAIADSATRAVRDCPLPTIAAISGYAIGDG